MKTFTLSDIDTVAKEVLIKAEEFSRAYKDQATLITLKGDLGAGKTTLTQALARALGVKETLISPTYIIMKHYRIPGSTSNFQLLTHIDVYRLESSDELSRLGWEALLSGQNNLIILEWPERVDTILPKEYLSVQLKHVDEQNRSIDIL